MAVISTLAVNIIAKTSGFTRGVRGTRATMNKFNNTIRNTRRLLTGLIAGTGIIRGFRSLISVASEAQETMAKFNTVFRDKGNARAVEAWADKFAKAVGRSKQDIKSYLAELQDIFVPMGFARDVAAKFAKSITQVGIDVASFNEKVDRDVMRNFTSAIMGSHRATRQYGIAISESRIQQESWNVGLNKNFSKLKDMEKIFLRYSIIMNDTADAQGDASRTQDDFANQLKRTKGIIKDLAQQIGDKLLPHLVGVLRVVRELVDRFSEMDVAALGVSMSNVRIVVSIGAFLFIVPKVVAAVAGLIKMLKALAKAQTINQALLGPAGIASLAAGMVVAAAAVAVLNIKFNKLLDTVGDLAKKTKEFAAPADLLRVSMADIRASLKGAGGDGRPEIIKTFQSLRKEIDKLIVSKDAMARLDLEEELGMSRFSTRGEALFDALEVILRIRGLVQAKLEGKSIFEEMLTPMEKYENRLAKLNRLLSLGAIGQRTFDRALHKAKEEMMGLDKDKGSFAGPGTAKVIREALISVSGLAIGTQDPSLSKMDAQIQEAQRANVFLQSINKLIAGQQDKLAGIPLKVLEINAKRFPDRPEVKPKPKPETETVFTNEQLAKFPSSFFGRKPTGPQLDIPQRNLSLRNRRDVGFQGRDVIGDLRKLQRATDPSTLVGRGLNAFDVQRNKVRGGLNLPTDFSNLPNIEDTELFGGVRQFGPPGMSPANEDKKIQEQQLLEQKSIKELLQMIHQDGGLN